MNQDIKSNLVSALYLLRMRELRHMRKRIDYMLDLCSDLEINDVQLRCMDSRLYACECDLNEWIHKHKEILPTPIKNKRPNKKRANSTNNEPSPPTTRFQDPILNKGKR